MDYSTKCGILGGTVFSVYMSVSWDDVLYTILMASIGAVVSFVISLVLRWIVKQFKP